MYSISIQNMSQVNSEEICIYNDESVIEAFKLESAVLKQEEGNAGTLTIKVPPTNVGYSAFETLTTMAIVRKKGEDYPYDEPKVIWIGRLLEMKIDFDNNKEIVFEGAYNFLMDTIQPPYHAKTDITLWAAYMISNHNTMVQASGQGWKTINVGVFDTAINPTETTDLYADYDTTLDMINNVCEGWSAHPRFRYGYSQTYHCWQLILDLYSTYRSDGERPQIAFGENLTDYTREYKNEDTATVVIPRGKKYTNQEWDALPEGTEPAVPDGVDKYRTIYSVNNQSIYCYPNPNDTEAVANLQRYGFICKTVDFSNEIDYNALKASGEKYLRDQKWDKTTITINGFDLKLMDYNAVPIKIGEMVHCVSRPHGLDYNYPCTAIEENLMEVGSTTYVLGFPDDRYMTDSSRKSDEKLRDAITQAVSREKILQQNTYDYTNNSIEDYDEQTVQGYVQSLEEEIQAISFDPSEAVEEAKTNALQLLNIYDEEKNPERKGFVHFVKETADYSSEGTITIGELKARVNKYFNSNAIETLFTNLNNILNDPSSSTYGPLTIFVLLGPNDYQTAITVWSASSSAYRRTDYDLFFYDYTNSGYNLKICTGYNNNYFSCYGYFYSINTSTSYCNWYGYNNTQNKYYITTIIDPQIGIFPYPFGTNNVNYAQYHFAYPCEEILKNIPDGYEAYISRKIYQDSQSSTEKYSPSIKLDPASDALTLSQLKQHITAKVASSDNRNTFLTLLDENIDRPDTMIFTMVKLVDGVEDWNYFKVHIIKNNAWQSAGASNFKFNNNNDYFYNTSSLGETKYSRYYGLLQVAGSNNGFSRLRSNSQFEPGSSNYARETDLNSVWAGSTYYVPNKATLASTEAHCYISQPVYASASSTEIYAPINLVSHVTDPQDHITEIVISDKADYMANDANLWRWNKEGLYYLNGGYNGATLPNGEYGSNTDNLRLALTKNGQIVADRITAGQLDAGIIRTGVLMGNPAVPGDPEGDADFKINVNTGTILAKKARLVFANLRQHSGTISDPDKSLTDFVYLSNEPINRYVDVSAQKSKDWMMIIGSSFGVDKYGRAYMREGHIGGDGGVFDIFAYNGGATEVLWLGTEDLGNNTYRHTWKSVVTISSDSYRVGKLTSENATFRFRIGYYDTNNQIQFESGLTSFIFEAGTAPKTFAIELNTTTTSSDQTPQPTEYPYYNGQLFPVWYVKDANGEYVEDNVAYKQMTGVDSTYQVKILGYLDNEETLPQYSSWTDERYQISGIDNSGAINIGPGYLDNGNTGQSQSFYLGGINRSATVANRAANDWRLTVGSRFGVTDEGNLYANNATLSNVWASGSITGSSFSAGYIPPISFNAKNPIEANFNLSLFEWRFWDEVDGGMFSTTTRLSITYAASDPPGFDETPASNKASIMERDLNITFKPSVYEFRNSGSHYEDGRRAASPITVTYSRTGADRQDFIVNTSDWNVPDSGWTFGDKVFILIDINNSSQTFYLQGQNQIKYNVNDPGDGTIYWLTGTMTMLKIDSQAGRNAVNCGADFMGKGFWLGGQYMPWARLYVDTVINTSSKIYKHDIEGLDARYDKLLDILRPVRFKFNKDHYDDGDLYHTGFILEELGECMKIAGIKPEEFAAYDPNPDGVGGGIRYSEFIPLIIDQLQKLKRENEDLRRQLYEKGILDD